MSSYLWDYDEEELKKTEGGRIFILERMINYGFAPASPGRLGEPGPRKKIRLAEVKKYWDKLHLFALQKRLFELLIWGKYRTSPKNNKSFWLK